MNYKMRQILKLNNMRNLAMVLLAVAAAHFAIVVGFYYQRIVHRTALFDSDLLVFFLPLAAGFCTCFCLTWFCGPLEGHPRAMKAIVAISAAAITIGISTICAMSFAFNRWGS